MKEGHTNTVRIKHILDAISEVEKYLSGVSYDEFSVNSEKGFATIKQIEIIGEASAAISSDIKDKYNDIEWKAMKGFRNISIHEYFSVDFHIVWEIAKNDLPVLKIQFNKILAEL